jgi:hypothetical protein
MRIRQVNSPPDACPLCGRLANKQDTGGDGHFIKCEQCGNFGISGTAESIVEGFDHRLKIKIGFWTRDQNALGDIPMVSSHAFDLVKRLPDKTVMERADRLLRLGIDEQKDLGGVFSLLTAKAIGVTHSMGNPDVLALAELLHGQGLMREGFQGGTGKITPTGFMRGSSAASTESVNGFIAMWFDSSMSTVRTDGLELAIRSAGYNPIIVSGVEHINKIDDEIISQIRKSKFLVADFTGHRGGVYFEAGFAMGLGLPVFWSCQRDDLSNLHFDVRQYNCIDWTDPADLATRLKRRIEAIIGAGPIRTDVVAH